MSQHAVNSASQLARDPRHFNQPVGMWGETEASVPNEWVGGRNGLTWSGAGYLEMDCSGLAVEGEEAVKTDLKFVRSEHLDDVARTDTEEAILEGLEVDFAGLVEPVIDVLLHVELLVRLVH